MQKDYEKSNRLENLGADLIAQHHSHLKTANIAYLMKTAPEDSAGPKPPSRLGKHPKMASVRTVPPLYRALCPYDFIVDVHEVYWDVLDLEQQSALMDHELSHCATDGKGWYVKDHDIEEFIGVIQRNGCWNSNLEALKEAYQMIFPFEGAALGAADNQVH